MLIYFSIYLRSKVNYKGYDWFGIIELHYIVSGKDKLQDKNLHEVVISLKDHLTQNKTVSDSLLKTNSQINFMKKNYFSEYKSEINFIEVESIGKANSSLCEHLTREVETSFEVFIMSLNHMQSE